MEFQKIIQELQKENKIKLKKRDEKNFVGITENGQVFEITNDSKENIIIIRGKKDPNNSFPLIAAKAEEIKNMITKYCEKKEVVIEIQ